MFNSLLVPIDGSTKNRIILSDDAAVPHFRIFLVLEPSLAPRSHDNMAINYDYDDRRTRLFRGNGFQVANSMPALSRKALNVENLH